MLLKELENRILHKIDQYIELWSADGLTASTENRVIAMKIAQNIVREEMTVARNWGNVEVE